MKLGRQHNFHDIVVTRAELYFCDLKVNNEMVRWKVNETDTCVNQGSLGVSIEDRRNKMQIWLTFTYADSADDSISHRETLIRKREKASLIAVWCCVGAL